MIRLCLVLLVACVQKPPHANVILHGARTQSHAVLVMPLTCMTYADVSLCRPGAWGTASKLRPPEASFGAYIDPALRLKLEFAGFTLAEAGAMRLATADRVDVNNESTVIETTDGPRTVAELSLEDARAVAASLQLQSMLVPHLTIRPAGPGEVSGELTVTLVDVATNTPQWTVSCKETMYSVEETPNRLANCAGNGVLAVLKPENLIGGAL